MRKWSIAIAGISVIWVMGGCAFRLSEPPLNFGSPPPQPSSGIIIKVELPDDIVNKGFGPGPSKNVAVYATTYPKYHLQSQISIDLITKAPIQEVFPRR